MQEIQVLEIWKDIIGFEGYYEISNLANVKSKSRIVYDKNGIKESDKNHLLMERSMNTLKVVGVASVKKQIQNIVLRKNLIKTSKQLNIRL